MLLVERWIIAALRHRKFFSIEELNQAIRELRDRINQRPFRKREGSRASQFAALDKPALNPLPAERFDLSQWSRAMDSLPYGALGGVYRPAHSAAVRTHPRRQAPPGDGLSWLPGHYSTGRTILTCSG